MVEFGLKFSKINYRNDNQKKTESTKHFEHQFHI